ncbi:MAG: LysE family translocator [Burkholderiaceae bacterium]|nr:LysE family translocator [Burkholderiaceae bacterium]
MPAAHDLALFALTVLVLNATPGVDLMLTLTATVRSGLRAGLFAVAGICTGCALHALVAACGLAALLAAAPAAFDTVKWLGAAYLLWLALDMLRAARRADAAVAPAAPAAAVRVFLQGLLTNALNPKVALFFLALLPQFIDAAAPDRTLAFLLLGGWLVVQSGLFLALFAWLVAPLARWSPPPRLRQALHATAAGVFVCLAARLALAQRTP